MDLHPKVSVIMCVYNGEKYLKESIESILNQTYTNFEFIIVDDGSKDKTNEIIKSYKDERIVLITNETNKNKTYSRNIALEKAQGEYIAIFDSDDISFPQRLEKQVEYLQENSSIGACGSQAYFIGLPQKLSYRHCPTNPEAAKCLLLFESPIAHPAAMVRKKIIDEFNIKYRDFIASEDYALWVDLAKHTQLSNLDEHLIYYRRHAEQESLAKFDLQLECDLSVKKEFYGQIGLNFNEEEYQIIKTFCSNTIPTDKKFIQDFEKILFKISEFNDINNFFDKNKLALILFQKWHNVCLKAGRNGLWSWNLFCNSTLSKEKAFALSFKEKIKFIINLIAGKLKLYTLYKKIIQLYLKGRH
jgi:glycosyltransferase involved in cell wall biosynthesis